MAAAAAASMTYTDETRFGAPYEATPKTPPQTLKMEPRLDAQPDASMGAQPDAVKPSSSAEPARTKEVRFEDEPDVKAVPPRAAVQSKPAPPPERPPIFEFVTGLTYQHVTKDGEQDVMFLNAERDAHGSTLCLVRQGTEPNAKEFCVHWQDLRIKKGIPPSTPGGEAKSSISGQRIPL